MNPRALLAAALLSTLLPAALAQPDISDRLAAGDRFDDAMERHAPLGKVPGVGAPAPCGDPAGAEDRYGDAIDYSSAMGGYSLLVWRRGRCELAHYHPPFDAQLRPDSASMHKTVVALLVAAAVADGYIRSADDPVGDYLTDWSDERAAIPLRALLTMSSGLQPLSREGGLESAAWRFVYGPVDAEATALGRPLVHPPGEHFHYMGLNTQLLLMVLEAATQRPYAQYLSERLWQPLGASDAWLWLYEEPAGMPRAYSAMHAVAEDWLRVGLLIKDRGRYDGRQLIPAALVDELTAPSSANPNYGWQLWLGNEYEPVRYYRPSESDFGMAAAEPFAVRDMIYLDGIGGQRVYISRSLDLVIVRQGNSRLDWDDTKLPNLVIRATEEGAQR